MEIKKILTAVYDEDLEDGVFRIPEDISKVDSEALRCPGLRKLVIPNTLSHIPNFAFLDNIEEILVEDGNECCSSVDGVLFNKEGTELLTYCAGNERTEYTVPEGTQLIKEYAFDSTESLVTINIPSSVQTIEDGAFYRTSNLKTINIDRSENAISGSKWRASNSVQVNWTGTN